MPERKQNSNTEILEKLESLDKKVTNLSNVMIGNAEEDKPGVLERVRKLEDWVTNEKRLIYIIVAIIISDVVTRLWSLLVK